MKSLLFVLLAWLPVTSLAQETHEDSRADTLELIVVREIPSRGLLIGPDRRYRYGQRRFIRPSRLRPYFLADGDSAAIAAFEKSRDVARVGNVLRLPGSVCVGSGITIIGVGLMGKLIYSPFLTVADRSGLNRFIWIGVATAGAGAILSIPGGILLRSSRRLLTSAINRYNQRRPPQASWQLAPTGTGLRLVGRF